MEGRALVEGFVGRMFAAASKGNVLWFRNWGALQSVRAVEHVHVLVRGMGLKGWETSDCRCLKGGDWGFEWM